MNNDGVLKLVRKYLKEITTSNKYYVKDEKYDFAICFKTEKYLTWLDKKYKRDYTYIAWCSYAQTQSLNKLVHTLIACAKVKSLKEKNMPLNVFIEEVFSWCSMCASLLAYGSTGEKYFTSRETYNLPESTKREVYDYMKSVLTEVKYGVGEDSEGCSYNSIHFNNILTEI